MGQVLRLISISVEGFQGVGELLCKVGEFLKGSLNMVVESGDFPMEGDNFLLQWDSLIFRGPFRGSKQGHGSVRVHGVRVGFWFCDLCLRTFVQVRGAS